MNKNLELGEAQTDRKNGRLLSTVGMRCLQTEVDNHADSAPFQAISGDHRRCSCACTGTITAIAVIVAIHTTSEAPEASEGMQIYTAAGTKTTLERGLVTTFRQKG